MQYFQQETLLLTEFVRTFEWFGDLHVEEIYSLASAIVYLLEPLAEGRKFRKTVITRQGQVLERTVLNAF